MHSLASTRPETESFLNVSNRKTTHSWPIIFRQSNHYASEDDDDDDEDNNYDDGYIDGNATDDDNNEYEYDDSDNDIDTIFPHKNQPIKTDAEIFIDNLSCRKYLVADYNPKQSNDYFTSTITSVVNAQSDFPISLKLNSSSASRLTRNSIVPLMSPQSQLHTPTRARNSLHEANVSAAINAAVSIDQTTCIAPPPLLFLLLTLLTTLSATGLLCFAVMTDHWEIIRWDRNLLDHLTSNTTNELDWHLDEKVARLSFARNYRNFGGLFL